MTIIYSCISRGSTVLCCSPSGPNEFSTTAATLLPQMAVTPGKTTYNSDRYLFHTLVEDGIVYLCCAGTGFGRQQPFAFLTEIHGRVVNSSLAFRLHNAPANGLQKEFGSIMASQMQRFSDSSGGSSAESSVGASVQDSNLTRIQSSVNEVKDVMTANIDKVLQRGDRLEDLMDRSEDLEASSQQFRATTRRVSRKFWWQNFRMKIICAVVILVLLIGVIVGILFATGALPPKSGGGSSGTVTTASPKP